MLSSNTFLAPPEDGVLICLWLPQEREAIRICELLEQLIKLPAIGMQWWDASPKALLVAWTDDAQAHIVRALFRTFGDPIDWPARLILSGNWTPLGGSPIYADREYEVTA